MVGTILFRLSAMQFALVLATASAVFACGGEDGRREWPVEAAETYFEVGVSPVDGEFLVPEDAFVATESPAAEDSSEEFTCPDNSCPVTVEEDSGLSTAISDDPKCGAAKAATPSCPVEGNKAAKLVASKGRALEKTPVVSTATLVALVRSGVPFVLLDARTGKYDDGKRLPGAKQLSPKATAEQAAEVIPAKNSLVVTYCSNVKCPASKYLAKQLASLGYTNVVKYPAGIQGWAEAGQPVVSVKK
jgi:rhodanese-related sulfurtransferase